MENGGWCHADIGRVDGSLTNSSDFFSTLSWLVAPFPITPHQALFFWDTGWSQQTASLRFCPGVQWSDLESVESIPHSIITRRVPTPWVKQACKGTNSELLLLRVHVRHHSWFCVCSQSPFRSRHKFLCSTSLCRILLTSSLFYLAIRIYCFNHFFFFFP